MLTQLEPCNYVPLLRDYDRSVSFLYYLPRAYIESMKIYLSIFSIDFCSDQKICCLLQRKIQANLSNFFSNFRSLLLRKQVLYNFTSCLWALQPNDSERLNLLPTKNKCLIVVVGRYLPTQAGSGQARTQVHISKESLVVDSAEKEIERLFSVVVGRYIICQ